MNGFFNKIRAGLQRFMAGRNGTDALNMALLIFYLVLSLFGTMLVEALDLPLLGAVVSFLLMFTFIVIVMRMFSRNLTKRQAENQRFLAFWNPKRAAFRGWNARRKDKDHCYFKCKHCGTFCRVPKGKGRIELTCPKCHEKMIVKS